MLRTRIVAGATSGFVMSAVFATVLTVTHFGEAFVEPWRVDPAQPAPITLRLPRTNARVRDPETGVYRYDAVTVVVPRGHTVKDSQIATMVRLYERERRPPRPTQLAAQWLLYFLIVLMGTAYMRQASSERAGLLRVQVSLLALAAVLLVGGKLGMLLSDLPPYLLPAAVVPLWASLYVDRRTGVMLSLIITLGGSSLVSYDPVVTVVYLMTTTTASLAFRGRRRATTMIPAGLLGGAAAAIVYVAVREIYDGFDLEHELSLELRSAPLASLMGGMGAGVLGLLLHVPISRMFGIVSRGELLNLSDLEQPLLQKMQNEAPGSWEHSRMMANLAEAAAASIHADALLTRVGAYYHDLGKSVQPQYFVENLQPGEASPHNELEPDVSADAIMAHVVEGVRILREGGVPEAVIEFAYTHHGTSVIEFFWHKCKKSGNPKGLTEDAFRYPGMRPRTREAGILMLIDAIEAGARTVDPPTREKFEDLVRRVIFGKLKQGQLDESGLTLEELKIVMARIVESLCSAYHSRIKYPWQEKEEEQQAFERARQTPSEQTSTGQHAAMRRSDVDGPSATGRHSALRNGERTRSAAEEASSTGKHSAMRNGERARPAAEGGSSTGKQNAQRNGERARSVAEDASDTGKHSARDGERARPAGEGGSNTGKHNAQRNGERALPTGEGSASAVKPSPSRNGERARPAGDGSLNAGKRDDARSAAEEATGAGKNTARDAAEEASGTGKNTARDGERARSPAEDSVTHDRQQGVASTEGHPRAERPSAETGAREAAGECKSNGGGADGGERPEGRPNGRTADGETARQAATSTQEDGTAPTASGVDKDESVRGERRSTG